METTYRYTKLPHSDSIRVLHLFPGEPSEDLECRLVPVQLSDQPSYRALSYVWGSRVPGATIKCDGDTIIITKNCEHALQQLRKKDCIVVLWIDAICIDQQDLKEKSHQVGIMGKIYKQASSVLVFIGPGTDDDAAVMERQVLMFSHIMQVSLSKSPTLREALDMNPSEDICAQISSEDFAAWKRTLSLPYWRRTWVLQEVGLAAHAKLIYGSVELDWEDLMRAFTWLSDSPHAPPIPSGRAIRSNWAGYDRLNRKQFSLRANGLTSDITFLDCLDTARRDRDATDPRDMVYAFLDHPNSHKFRPDYFQSVDLVYYNFAVSCLREHNNLNILSYATRSAECKPTDDLPSWCPKWDDKGPLPYPFAGLNRSEDYKAAGTIPLQYKVDGASLKVSGVYIGTVASTTSVIGAEDISGQSDQNKCEPGPILHAFRSIHSTSLRSGERYQDLITSFAGAITAGKGFSYSKNLQTARDVPNQDAGSIAQWYRDLEGGGYPAALNRRFFILSDGYMGVGPPNTRLGDTCSLIFGSDWPYILREGPNGTYELIGECYVEGLMDGSATEMLERGDLRSSSIALV